MVVAVPIEDPWVYTLDRIVVVIVDNDKHKQALDNSAGEYPPSLISRLSAKVTIGVTVVEIITTSVLVGVISIVTVGNSVSVDTIGTSVIVVVT